MLVVTNSVTSFATSAVAVWLVSVGGTGSGPLLLLLLMLLELDVVFVASLLVSVQCFGAHADDGSGAAELDCASEEGHDWTLVAV